MANRFGNERIEIKPTKEEKALFEENKRLSKCRNISHFIRKCVLEKEIYQVDLEPFRNLQGLLSNATYAPIIGTPYGLTKNPIINASIPMVASFCKKDAIAPNMQNIISKYIRAVPIPSRNVRNAVRILNTKLIGNKIIFIIHLIISYSSLSKTFFVSPHTISMQTFTSI